MITEKEATEIKELIKEAIEKDRRKRYELYLDSFMEGLIGALIFFGIIFQSYIGSILTGITCCIPPHHHTFNPILVLF